MEYLPVLKYLLAFGVMAAVGAPIAALVFRALPRRGGAFAIPSAMVAFAVAVFWIGQVTFGLHAVVLALTLVAIGGLLAHRAGARPDWRTVATTYGVFAVGFSILVVLRTTHPSITPAGGEQFLHFGLANAIERASSLPPEDFWYAGEPLRYYYGTQLQVTSLAMLTGTELRYGFNLGIASFYGVLFVVAYGLVGSIVANRGRSYHFGGVLGAFLVALGGPTTTAVRLATPLLPDPVARPVARGAFGFVAHRFEDGNLETAVAELSDPGTWTWWFTRYVVPGTIQEVPLYSFVKADLHGHALSAGYVLFAGAVAYAYVETPTERRARRAAVLVGGLGTVAGLFGFMNTWALPTAGGLAMLAVAVADPHPVTLLPRRLEARLRSGVAPITGADEPGRKHPNDDPLALDGKRARWKGRLEWLTGELSRAVLGSVAGLVVVGVGVAVASPFLVFGQVPSNEGIGLFPPRSPLGPFLVIYAGMLALGSTYVVVRGWSAIADGDRRILATVGVAYLVATVLAALGGRLGVLAVTAPLLVGAWLLARSERGDFALVLLVAGVGLVLSLEFVHAKLPHIDPPRWNTALKVAVQGWTLGAAGAAAGATLLLGRWLDRVRAAPTGTGPGTGTEGRVRGALRSSPVAIVVVVALLASAVFPAMVVYDEVGEDVADGSHNPSIDGRTYLDERHPEEAAAIDWLDDRPGTPTIVEAPGGPYQFTSPMSTFTGLPTVIGWDHQVEYRSPEAYRSRVIHVDAIYAGDRADAARHLERYDVSYVVVGPNERDRYGRDLRSFDRPAFSVAYENDAVTIYRVDQSMLDDARTNRLEATDGSALEPGGRSGLEQPSSPRAEKDKSGVREYDRRPLPVLRASSTR